MAFQIDEFLSNLSTYPGVYRMLGAAGEIIYVGKARNLKNRVTSYFRGAPNTAKLSALRRHIDSIECTVTNTEGEALILENNLIKQHQPRYNVLLRDDKSYPYIYVNQAEFPRLSFYRGGKNRPGQFFGPYPSASATRHTLNTLQQVFQLRQCDDSFFRNRSRPCLQHQIKRCSAPCTAQISAADYRTDVEHAMLFLQGKNDDIIAMLVAKMDQAAADLEFERAAAYRDQITRLRQISATQYVSMTRGDVDIVAGSIREGAASLHVLFIRDGHVLGSKNYFPRVPRDEALEVVISAFIAQHYLGQSVPNEIIVSHPPADLPVLTTVLNQQVDGKVEVTTNVRGERARWLALAQRNAEMALTAQLSGKAAMVRRFETLRDELHLEFTPGRLECFDISHTQGEATVASCVVFDGKGAVKSHYRRYNIKGPMAPGDDYAAMREVLTRRYTKIQSGDGVLPDILFVDGGKGQLRQAMEVLGELQVNDVLVYGIAKGPDRKAGLEVLFNGQDGSSFSLAASSPALHLIQQIRDEAHRFAITGHRQARGKARQRSVLEDIPGLGPKRRQQLLKQFGGLRQLQRASVEDITRVEGIGKSMAKRIYDALR